MKNRKLLGFPLVGGLFVPCLLSGQILLSDAFTGNAVDSDLWVESGFGGSRGNIEVSDGILRMNNNTTLESGASDHKGLTSVIDSFNFHSGSVSVDVGILSFAEPSWGELSFSDASGSMWFALGNVTNAAGARSNSSSAFAFNLTWRRDKDGIYIGRYGSNRPGGFLDNENYLSGVPERVQFTVDANSFTITLVGADFLDEAGGSSIGSTLTSAHSIPIQDNYFLTFGIANRRGNNTHGGDGNHALIAEFSDITVIPEPSVYASLLGLMALALLYFRRRS